MLSAAVLGASGYTGAELLRLCAGHPDLDVSHVTAESQSGRAVADLYPSLRAWAGDRVFAPNDPALVEDVDVVFLALPHGVSQSLVPDLRKRARHLVDLSADFRLKDASLYPDWYKAEHEAPALLAEFVYGLPELNRQALEGAELVAAAGCYVTAASLALAPFVEAGAIETTGIVIDAASGVSGAGRALKESTHFGTVNEDFVAYGLLDHRHTPEIEQAIGAEVLFTPHLAPMTRGILATCYARPSRSLDTRGALELLADRYGGEPFVVVDERPPSTKATLGSNAVHITARVDARTGWLVVLAALDNLVKGASGQAIQCANLALGLPETAGLSALGIYP